MFLSGADPNDESGAKTLCRFAAKGRSCRAPGRSPILRPSACVCAFDGACRLAALDAATRRPRPPRREARALRPTQRGGLMNNA